MAIISQLGQSKLVELENTAAHPVVVAELSRIMAEASETDGSKINPLALGDRLGVPRIEAVRAFLFAARLGLVDLNWDIHCPSCQGIPDFSKRLMQLKVQAHCRACEINWDADFAEQVEVTFTINPEVSRSDPNSPAQPEALPSRGFCAKRAQREGRSPVAMLQLEHANRHVVPIDVKPGHYRYYLLGKVDQSGALEVTKAVGQPDVLAAETHRAELIVREDGSFDNRFLVLSEGRGELVITSNYAKPRGFIIYPVELWSNWLSAAYVSSLQDFRDLFSDEFLAPDVQFAVRSTTLMFTDIKGSTQMYEQLGDAAAYKRVQDHFRVMTEIIRRHEGGIIKTIGDAIMASFQVNLQAVLAACEIQRQFHRISEELGGIEVKIGVHRGPAIAVTSNRLLDFFGRTVNLAARIQGESLPQEVLLSAEVLGDPAVQHALNDQRLGYSTRMANLKGIAETMKLYSLKPAAQA